MTRDEMKNKWVEELRSGKHKQIRCSRFTIEGKCCLGVLCYDVLGHRVEENEGYELIQEAFNSDPADYWKLNDKYRLSFEEIADIIEKEDWDEKYPEKV